MAQMKGKSKSKLDEHAANSKASNYKLVERLIRKAFHKELFVLLKVQIIIVINIFRCNEQ